jgi:hypothetical protein
MLIGPCSNGRNISYLALPKGLASLLKEIDSDCSRNKIRNQDENCYEFWQDALGSQHR